MSQGTVNVKTTSLGKPNNQSKMQHK